MTRAPGRLPFERRGDPNVRRGAHRHPQPAICNTRYVQIASSNWSVIVPRTSLGLILSFKRRSCISPLTSRRHVPQWLHLATSRPHRWRGPSTTRRQCAPLAACHRLSGHHDPDRCAMRACTRTCVGILTTSEGDEAEHKPHARNPLVMVCALGGVELFRSPALAQAGMAIRGTSARRSWPRPGRCLPHFPGSITSWRDAASPCQRIMAPWTTSPWRRLWSKRHEKQRSIASAPVQR